MSILSKLTSQQKVDVYNVFATKNGSTTVKKFKDAETANKRLQDISRGQDHKAVIAALKKAKVPANIIKLLPDTPIAVPVVPQSAPVVEVKPSPISSGNAAEIIEKERVKEKVKVSKQEKKEQAAVRKEIRLTDGVAEVFRALRDRLKKRDDDIDTTALAKHLKTSTVAVIKAVEKLQKMNLVKLEDDSPSDEVRLLYVSLTRAGLSTSLPATNNVSSASESAPKKAALPGDKPGPRSASNGKKIYKLVDGNPRREGTHGYRSFSLIKDGMSYEQYKSAGGRNNDLAWDIAHSFVELR